MKNKCVNCGNCCRETEMIMSTQDIARIKDKYSRTMGSINFVKKTVDGLFQLRNVNGNCVFFDPTTGLCKIYDVRPEGCRFYPLIYDIDEKLCVLDQDCPKPELFYPTKISRLRTCEKVVDFLEKQVIFTKLR